MMRYWNYDIVFAEVPGEVSLAINITGCPNRCQGCHSPWLWKDVGEELSEQNLIMIVDRYARDITCVCFMGGDAEPERIQELSKFVRKNYKNKKVAWYSGNETISEQIDIRNFDYIKTGAYIAKNGALKSPSTNQRFWRINAQGEKEDLTCIFWKK